MAGNEVPVKPFLNYSQLLTPSPGAEGLKDGQLVQNALANDISLLADKFEENGPPYSPLSFSQPDDIEKWMEGASHQNPLILQSSLRTHQLLQSTKRTFTGKKETLSAWDGVSSTDSLESIHYTTMGDGCENTAQANLPQQKDPHNQIGQLMGDLSSIKARITFMDGAAALRQMPDSLLRQLTYAINQHGGRPDCVRNRQSMAVYEVRGSRYGSVQFVDAETGDELLAARYAFEPGGQIIAVQHEAGLLSNGADAAIVTWYKQDTENGLAGKDVESKASYWAIWDPMNQFKSTYYVKRVTMVPTLHTQAKIRFVDPMPEPHAGETFDVDVQVQKQQKLMISGQHTSIPHCHNLQPKSRYGRILRKPVGFTISVQKRRKVRGYKSNRTKRSTGHAKANADAETCSSDLQPTTASTPPSHTSEEPIFAFKQSAENTLTRVRSLKICNTAEKLFANALAAGIAVDSTVLLKVQVGAHKPIYVVRNDVEDFDRILKLSQDEAFNKPVTIEVTVVEDHL